MSRWRREASDRLPELQHIIASKDVDNPMMLWIEMNVEFDRILRVEPIQNDLLKRIWSYCLWCMSHKNTDVQTAAALGFAEHLLDTDKRKAIIPKIMSRSDFISIRNLLEYHNSPADVEHYLKASWI